jgi:uroporphyrinogen decarboxylase
MQRRLQENDKGDYAVGRLEQVKKAIHMQGPDYVPVLFFNKDREQSDLIMIDVVRHFMGQKKDMSEWGFRWERKDETMGQPEEEVIKEWEDFRTLKMPDAFDPGRFSKVEENRLMYGNDRYYLASLVLTGFSVMSFMRGFSNIMEDLYLEREYAEKLADAVFGFEENIIRQLKSYGFHGVAFFDDWGTQSNLLISPGLWREFFKPRYKKQFDLAHQSGLDVYFHCCGCICDIIPDFLEIGVDMLNISQPNLFDIEDIGREFGGKVCFVCPVSYQTTSISGTREDIFGDVKKLVDHLGRFNGGLLGYVEEYGSIGMPDENYRHCIEAFRTLGNYKRNTRGSGSEEARNETKGTT